MIKSLFVGVGLMLLPFSAQSSLGGNNWNWLVFDAYTKDKKFHAVIRGDDVIIYDLALKKIITRMCSQSKTYMVKNKQRPPNRDEKLFLEDIANLAGASLNVTALEKNPRVVVASRDVKNRPTLVSSPDFLGFFQYRSPRQIGESSIPLTVKMVGKENQIWIFRFSALTLTNQQLSAQLGQIKKSYSLNSISTSLSCRMPFKISKGHMAKEESMEHFP